MESLNAEDDLENDLKVLRRLLDNSEASNDPEVGASTENNINEKSVESLNESIKDNTISMNSNKEVEVSGDDTQSFHTKESHMDVDKTEPIKPSPPVDLFQSQFKSHSIEEDIPDNLEMEKIISIFKSYFKPEDSFELEKSYQVLIKLDLKDHIIPSHLNLVGACERIFKTIRNAVQKKMRKPLWKAFRHVCSKFVFDFYSKGMSTKAVKVFQIMNNTFSESYVTYFHDNREAIIPILKVCFEDEKYELVVQFLEKNGYFVWFQQTISNQNVSPISAPTNTNTTAKTNALVNTTTIVPTNPQINTTSNTTTNTTTNTSTNTSTNPPTNTSTNLPTNTSASTNAATNMSSIKSPTATSPSQPVATDSLLALEITSVFFDCMASILQQAPPQPSKPMRPKMSSLDSNDLLHDNRIWYAYNDSFFRLSQNPTFRSLCRSAITLLCTITKTHPTTAVTSKVAILAELLRKLGIPVYLDIFLAACLSFQNQVKWRGVDYNALITYFVHTILPFSRKRFKTCGFKLFLLLSHEGILEDFRPKQTAERSLNLDSSYSKDTMMMLMHLFMFSRYYKPLEWYITTTNRQRCKRVAAVLADSKKLQWTWKCNRYCIQDWQKNNEKRPKATSTRGNNSAKRSYGDPDVRTFESGLPNYISSENSAFPSLKAVSYGFSDRSDSFGLRQTRVGNTYNHSERNLPNKRARWGDNYVTNASGRLNGRDVFEDGRRQGSSDEKAMRSLIDNIKYRNYQFFKHKRRKSFEGNISSSPFNNNKNFTNISANQSNSYSYEDFSTCYPSSYAGSAGDSLNPRNHNAFSDNLNNSYVDRNQSDYHDNSFDYNNNSMRGCNNFESGYNHDDRPYNRQSNGYIESSYAGGRNNFGNRTPDFFDHSGGSDAWKRPKRSNDFRNHSPGGARERGGMDGTSVCWKRLGRAAFYG